ncbi:TTC17 protein, partial [Pedionomus torquatus]|nr:TTC17 protein [Pedionomus torquatus]
GVQERVNLSAPLLPKEDPIFTYLSRRLGRSIEEIGHRIYDGLMKNSSSWVLYNMASFYWRIKNEPYQVVECAMRALHFSSRQNKDIALVNLANILHRAHFSADAAIVVHAALDYSDFFTSYYTLGNIYAVNTIFIFQDFIRQLLLMKRQGVSFTCSYVCGIWNKSYSLVERVFQYNSLEVVLIQCCISHLFLQHKMDHNIHQRNIAAVLDLQMKTMVLFVLPCRMCSGVSLYLFGEDSSTSSMTSVNLDLYANQSDHSQSLQSSPIARSIISVWSVESNRETQHILWPHRSECMKSFPRIPDPEELPTYFLPPENRGFRQVDTVGHGEMQAPDCSSITDARNNESLNILIKELDSNLDLKLKMPDDQARQILHSRINNQSITEANIGVFLDHAMKQPEDSLWLVLNEAGLYWRAVGNSTFAITCLQKAFNLAPHEYQDIPLVNLANLLIHYGLHLDAS